MKLTLLFLFGTVLVACSASPAIDNTIHPTNRNQFEEAFMKKLNTKCSQRDNSSCVMLKLVTYMNRMLKKSSIDVSESLKITQTREEIVTETEDDKMLYARAAGSDEGTLSIMIADKIYRFFNSRSLRWRIFDTTDFVVSSEPQGSLNFGFNINAQKAIESGRGRMKRIGPLIAGFVAGKLSVLAALAFKGLILLVGKAIIVSKVALIVALVIGAKKFFNKKHVTYEVVAHPHHTHESVHHEPAHHHSTGWGRALNGFLDSVADALPDDGGNSHVNAYSGHIK